MNDRDFRNQAERILINMALEQTGWRRLFNRWYINAEPLRNDAANLLRRASTNIELPENSRIVGSK